MSVYTPVSAADLDAWLLRYAVGGLAELTPIASGIENTNYFVTTERGRYVLTLYERLPTAELPFYLNLMAHLARAGVEVPAPVADRTGALFSLLNGKPAGLVERVDGAPVDAPTRRIARTSARRSRACTSRRSRIARGSPIAADPRGGGRRRARSSRISPRRPGGAARRRDQIPDRLRPRASSPKGAIHGDLFCDNVLFAGDRVAGIIDFGFAATDFFAYDLAITVNDWCVDAAGRHSTRHDSPRWSQPTTRCAR